jgi:hypothetical protein
MFNYCTFTGPRNYLCLSVQADLETFENEFEHVIIDHRMSRLSFENSGDFNGRFIHGPEI